MLAQGRVIHLRLQGYLLLMLYDLEPHPQLLSPLSSLCWHYAQCCWHYAHYTGIMLPYILALCSLCFHYTGIMLNMLPLYWHYAWYASIILALCSVLPLCWHYAGIMLNASTMLVLCWHYARCFHYAGTNIIYIMLAESTHASYLGKFKGSTSVVVL